MDSNSLHAACSGRTCPVSNVETVRRASLNEEQLSPRIDLSEIRRAGPEVGGQLFVAEKPCGISGCAHFGEAPRQWRVPSDCSHTQPPSSMLETDSSSETVAAQEICTPGRLQGDSSTCVSHDGGHDPNRNALRWHVSPGSLPSRGQGWNLPEASVSDAGGHSACALSPFDCAGNEGPLMRGRLKPAQMHQQQEGEPLLRLSPHAIGANSLYQQQGELPPPPVCVEKQPPLLPREQSHQLAGAFAGLEAKVPHRHVADESFPEVKASLLGHPQTSGRTPGSSFTFKPSSPLCSLPNTRPQQHLAPAVHQTHISTHASRREGITDTGEAAAAQRPGSTLAPASPPRLDQPERVRWIAHGRRPYSRVILTASALPTPAATGYRPSAGGGPSTHQQLGLPVHCLHSPRRTEHRDCPRPIEPHQDHGLLRTPRTIFPELIHLSRKHESRDGQQQVQNATYQQVPPAAQHLRKTRVMQDDPYQAAPPDNQAGSAPCRPYPVVFPSKAQQKQQQQGPVVHPQLHPLQQQQLLQFQQQQQRVLAQESQTPLPYQSLRQCTTQTELTRGVFEGGLTHPREGHAPSVAQTQWGERRGAGACEMQQSYIQQMQWHTSCQQQGDLQHDSPYVARDTSRVYDQQSTAEHQEYPAAERSKAQHQQHQSYSGGYLDVLHQQHHRTLRDGYVTQQAHSTLPGSPTGVPDTRHNPFPAVSLSQLQPCRITNQDEVISGSIGGNLLREENLQDLDADQRESRGGYQVDIQTLQSGEPSQVTTLFPGDSLLRGRKVPWLQCAEKLGTKHCESTSYNNSKGDPVEPSVEHAAVLSDSHDSENLHALAREPGSQQAADSNTPLDTLGSLEIHSQQKQERPPKSFQSYRLGVSGDISQNMQVLCGQQVFKVSPIGDVCFSVPTCAPGPRLQGEEDALCETGSPLRERQRVSSDGPRSESTELPTAGDMPRLPATPDKTATRRSWGVSTTESDFEAGLNQHYAQHQINFPYAQPAYKYCEIPPAPALEVNDSPTGVLHTFPVGRRDITFGVREPAETHPSPRRSFTGLHGLSTGSLLPQANNGSSAEGDTPQSLPRVVQRQIPPLDYHDSVPREEARYRAPPELMKFFSPEQQLAHTSPPSCWIPSAQKQVRGRPNVAAGILVLETVSCPQPFAAPSQREKTHEHRAPQEQHVRQAPQEIHLLQQQEDEVHQYDSQMCQQQQQQHQRQADTGAALRVLPPSPSQLDQQNENHFLHQNIAASETFPFGCAPDTWGANDADWSTFVVKLLVEHKALSPAVLSPDGGVREWLIPPGFSFVPTQNNKAYSYCLRR